MKILTVVGARPQFIKAAAVSQQVIANDGLEECLVHTGQHYDANMSDSFFDELGIPLPKYNLGIAGLSHGAMTGRMLEAIEMTIRDEGPDVVLVYGDTNSTIAGALAAAKLRVPVAHVEAGLRSFNRAMPEEVNRILTDHCSDLLFAPTETALQNLAAEGIADRSVVLTGDVMFDVAQAVAKNLPEQSEILRRHRLKPKCYVLATVHRQETTDNPDRLEAVIRGLAEVARELPVALPLHPRTRARIEANGLSDIASEIILLPPLGYHDMVGITSRASVVVTDSGGLQKEAFFHKVPCVTLRTETEWTELITAGWNRLASLGSSREIAEAVLSARGTRGADIAPYGDGSAAQIIVSHLIRAYA